MAWLPWRHERLSFELKYPWLRVVHNEALRATLHYQIMGKKARPRPTAEE